MKRRTALITDAERSPAEQLRSRQIRYVSMMGLRAACLIIGGILLQVRAPLLWLWLPICGVGMVLLPWLAVIIANDRLAKDRHRLLHRRRRDQRVERADRALPADATEPRTIDADP